MIVQSGPSRRGLLSALGLGLAATALPGRWARAADDTKPTITADEALKRLMAGHANYQANRLTVRDYAAGREARAKGQSPIAAILSCADSRVPAELIFDQGHDDIFVIRVAGNIENPDILASLEYGVKFLGIPLIMVMGHSGCGAVDAAIKVYRDKTVLPGHLPGLVDQIIPAVKIAEGTKPTDLLAASVTENVRLTTRQIAASAAVLAPLVTAGTLKVVGAVYDLASGKVTMV